VSRLRDGMMVVGVGTVLFGVLLLTTPPLAAGLTTSEVMLSVLGVTALLLGGASVVRGGSGGDASPDHQPTSRPPSVVGRSFERRLRSRSPESRDRLETAAVDVLTRLRGLDPETAREQLERGDWTDDRLAAAFFAPGISARQLRRPTWLGGEPVVVRQARAVVGALARIVDEETRDTVTDPDEADDGSVGAPPVAADGSAAAAAAPDMAGSRPDTHSDATPVDRSPDAEGWSRRTGRWAGMGALTLLTVALAVVARRPALLVPAAIGVAMAAYAAYGRAGSPSPVSLAVERRLSDEAPEQGDPVEVTVTVRNEGDRMLPDIRLVDGVPGELPVTAGGPEAVATLRPDEAVRFTYTVTAEYGDHEFDPPLTLLRDATGERERVVRPTAAGTTLSCHPQPEAPTGVPLRAETTGHVGRITADDGGSGLAFHAVRDHRPGDPLSLIDWKRFARTGDLATIQFEQERRTDVVLAVDNRDPAIVMSGPTTRSALNRAVEAADVMATTLLGAGSRVGVSALATPGTWLAPGQGTDHEARLRELLATDPAFDAAPAEGPFVRSVYVTKLRRRLSEGTQVVLLSPLVDDTPLHLVRQLEASGVPVTVLSPDPADSRTVGGLLGAVERSTRVAALRRERIHVVDWAPDERLALALARNADLPVVVG
jgi:uncharacterized protein (DUF58 family)